MSFQDMSNNGFPQFAIIAISIVFLFTEPLHPFSYPFSQTYWRFNSLFPSASPYFEMSRERYIFRTLFSHNVFRGLFYGFEFRFFFLLGWLSPTTRKPRLLFYLTHSFGVDTFLSLSHKCENEHNRIAQNTNFPRQSRYLFYILCPFRI